MKNTKAKKAQKTIDELWTKMDTGKSDISSVQEEKPKIKVENIKSDIKVENIKSDTSVQEEKPKIKVENIKSDISSVQEEKPKIKVENIKSDISSVQEEKPKIRLDENTNRLIVIDIPDDPECHKKMKMISGWTFKDGNYSFPNEKNNHMILVSILKEYIKTAKNVIMLYYRDERIKVVYKGGEFNDFLKRIRSISGRKFIVDKDGKYWTVPLNVEVIKNTFKDYKLEIDYSLKMKDDSLKTEKIVPKEINKMMKQQMLIDMFPISYTNVPILYTYKLAGKGISEIGHKFSYRLSKKFGGHWVFADNMILTDNMQTNDDVMNVVKDLWSEQSDTFGNIQTVRLDNDQQPSPQAVATFVSNRMSRDLEPEINIITKNKSHDIGKVYIKMLWNIRGWVVQNNPAVSISDLIYKQDLKSYVEHTPSENLNGHLDGLWVADKTSTLKGKILEIVGKLGQHRERLLNISKRKMSIDIIKKASDEEIVVKVLSRHKSYDYVVSALNIVLRPEYYGRFGINSRQVVSATRIEPSIRYKIIDEISKLAINRKFISNAYNSNDSSGIFLNSTDFGFIPQVLIGEKKIVHYDKKILINLRRHGLYKVSEQFQHNLQINIGIINTLPISVKEFLSKLQQELKYLKFEMNIVGEEIIGSSRIDLEQGIGNLQVYNPHIILAFVEKDDDAYFDIKELTINRGLTSQGITRSGIDNQWAMGNIVLGILGKIGNIPFILGKPLPYADIVVGIDISRETKKLLAGSNNVMASTFIYNNSGEFLRYDIRDVSLEGETIPYNVWKNVLPVDKFKNKRIIIQRDGYYPRDELEGLKRWGKQIDAEFYPVEVIKNGVPRIYEQTAKIGRPSTGTVFKLSDNEAFLVSSLPLFENATPQPLRIRSREDFSIEKAIHSVLSMTILHIGSVTPPRLPVPIHYSHKIAKFALRGIKPRNLEGSIPFWL